MPPRSPLAEQHSRAMMEHLIPRSAAVVLHEPDDTVSSLGSGSCITIGRRHFIATAAHVIRNVALGQVGVIALGRPVGEHHNITPRLVGWGHRGGERSDAVDVAWLEIKQAAVPRLLSEWGRVFITLDRVSLDPVPADAAMFVFGAPVALAKLTQLEGKPFLGIGALPYLTRAIPAPPGQGSPEHDVCVEYLSEMETAEGTVPMPPAPGLSGSGLWRVNPSGSSIWSPDSARLVAVQQSWMPDQYLRGTRIGDWLKMVREDIPELASEIDLVLNQTA